MQASAPAFAGVTAEGRGLGNRQRYAIALGSNRAHGHHGSPGAVIAAAIERLGIDARLLARSRTIETLALGPGGRCYANAAMLIETRLDPPALLAQLKAIERDFGRRPGRRWGPRVLDLDILLWSGGRWRTRTLVIPHRQLARRRFVLDPLAEIAPGWRLPASPLRVRHLAARLTRRVPSA